MIDIFYKGNYKPYIGGYSPLCTYLKTKESYGRWVTRRLWGFRHQISKAKYPKILVADIKYLKKNISKCRSHISGSFRRKPRHCAKWLRNSPGKRYQRIWICLTGEVETLSSPIWRQAPNAKYPENVERHPTRIPNVRHLGGMAAE